MYSFNIDFQKSTFLLCLSRNEKRRCKYIKILLLKCKYKCLLRVCAIHEQHNQTSVDVCVLLWCDKIFFKFLSFTYFLLIFTFLGYLQSQLHVGHSQMSPSKDQFTGRNIHSYFCSSFGPLNFFSFVYRPFSKLSKSSKKTTHSHNT